MNKPPFRCLFDNDTTNIVRAAKPEFYDPATMTPESFESGGDFTDAMIEARIDETVGTGVDVHKLSPGHSRVTWWKSAIAPAEEHYRWFEQTYGRLPDAYGRYMLDRRRQRWRPGRTSRTTSLCHERLQALRVPIRFLEAADIARTTKGPAINSATNVRTRKPLVSIDVFINAHRRRNRP